MPKIAIRLMIWSNTPFREGAKAGYFGWSVFGRAASCARAAIIASYSGVPRRGGAPSGRPPIQCGMSAIVSPAVRPPAQAGSARHARQRKAHRKAAE